MQETWVAPSSGHCWMVVVQVPPSPASPARVLPSRGTTPASAGGVTVSVPEVRLPLHPSVGRNSASALTAAAGHRTVDLTLALSFLGVFTLVPALLAVNQGQLGLHATLLLIQRERDQRAPFFPNFSRQAIDLTAVKQQLPLAARVVVALVGKGVHTDIHLVQPGLATIDVRERVDERDLPGADRFDLGAHQHDPGLDRFVHVVLVACLLVAREHLHGVGGGGLGHGDEEYNAASNMTIGTSGEGKPHDHRPPFGWPLVPARGLRGRGRGSAARGGGRTSRAPADGGGASADG